MSIPMNEHEMEARYPHGTDVLERNFSDGGFSAGWAMHCKPVPRYYFDAHIHYKGPADKTLAARIKADAEKAAELDVLRSVVMLQLYGEKWSPVMLTDNVMDKMPYFTALEMREYVQGLSAGQLWGAYLNYHSPEPELVEAAADMGASYIKLHNAPVIEDNAPYDLWLTGSWQETFRTIAHRKLPVLWHVTQRLASSCYTGGGRNSYWQKGWQNGVTYTNEDLLQVFLTCCRRYPDIKFIGAHQLHVGWDRLDELFTGYPNLYVDTTIGCALRLYDDLYEHDREYLRSVFMRWADRLVFGTDTFWGIEGAAFNTRTNLEHMRFISALDLPEDTLNKICHGNMERLCRIEEL